ncbi:hypothetical protein [Streptomyces capoamus]|uniref:Uncharacterized protein n=1 Tax=Streptomyces capoamus TaxID=68183 RepID=A0A919C5L8_9ACTN|nr:hypothetical protein [Streptomyces capoamus]GGW15213.1 hypothetical protein GCM10010501_26340 [Streptomyces libani subsp. rufus]GHG54868.1 hypothetical protein GCM10018980_39850 [Streptomyces capoamus]
MGMKDQFQEKSRQAKEKMDQGREKAGQRAQQGRQGQPGRPGQQPPERSGQNHRDIEDTEQQVTDRFDQDYDA